METADAQDRSPEQAAPHSGSDAPPSSGGGSAAAPASHSATPSAAITDSPWLWMLVFSGMAIVGTLAIERRHNRREAMVEQKLLDRQSAARFAQQESGQTGPSASAAAPATAASPNSTAQPAADTTDQFPPPSRDRPVLFSLTPVRLILTAMAIAAGGMLARQRRREAFTHPRVHA